MCLIVLYANVKEINHTSLFVWRIVGTLVDGIDSWSRRQIIYTLLDGLPGFARIPKRKINQEF